MKKVIKSFDNALLTNIINLRITIIFGGKQAAIGAYKNLCITTFLHYLLVKVIGSPSLFSHYNFFILSFERKKRRKKSTSACRS